MNPGGGFDISSLTRQSPASMAAAAAAFMANQGHHSGHHQHNPLAGHGQHASFGVHHHGGHQGGHLTSGHPHHVSSHYGQQQHQQQQQHHQWTPGLGPHNLNHLGMGGANSLHAPGHHSVHGHVPPPTHHLTGHLNPHLGSGGGHHMSPMAHLSSMSPSGHSIHANQQPTVTHIPTPHHMQSQLMQNPPPPPSGHGHGHGHGSSHPSLPSSQVHHQQPARSDSVQPARPDSVQPARPDSVQPTPVLPAMNDANNQLASSVNLSSIQSLVDVLVELPLPSEGPEYESRRPQLLYDPVILQHVSSLVSPSIESQTHVSQILGPAMVSAKQVLHSLDLNFLDPITSLGIIDPNEAGNMAQSGGTKSSGNKCNTNSGTNSNGNANTSDGSTLESKCSTVQVQNSYLLSLLDSMDCFSNPSVNLPPTVTVRQTRSQQQVQQSYWNPWEGQQIGQPAVVQQFQDQVVASTATGVTATGVTGSPAHFNTTPSAGLQTANNVYSSTHSIDNNNSNSNSNFDQQQSQGLLQQQGMANQGMANQGMVDQSYQPMVNQGMVTQYQEIQNQQQYQSQQGYDPSLDVKALNSEPMVVLDKIDVDQALLDYYKSTNGPSESNEDST